MKIEPPPSFKKVELLLGQQLPHNAKTKIFVQFWGVWKKLLKKGLGCGGVWFKGTLFKSFLTVRFASGLTATSFLFKKKCGKLIFLKKTRFICAGDWGAEEIWNAWTFFFLIKETRRCVKAPKSNWRHRRHGNKIEPAASRKNLASNGNSCFKAENKRKSKPLWVARCCIIFLNFLGTPII